jgi:hypothetical protein
MATIPKPEGWKASLVVLGRTLTYDPEFSSEEFGGFAVWHDPADEVELKYHYVDLAPDFAGERVEVWDTRDGGNQGWVYQRAAGGGWQVNPSGLPPEALAAAPEWNAGPEKYPLLRSSASERFATDMRDALKALMEADPYYFDVPIVTERLQNIEAKIEQLVAKAGGICVVLVTATFEKPISNIPGANFNAIRFFARVFENVKTNATGKEAQHVALYTAALWSQLKPDAFSSPLVLDDPGVALGNDPRFLTYDVQALTPGGTKIEIPRLDDVTIDVSNLSAIALANPRPGAFIFYTVDGSEPAPRNPAAQVFLDPFSSAPGVTVRARAWLPGYIPSAKLKQVL